MSDPSYCNDDSKPFLRVKKVVKTSISQEARISTDSTVFKRTALKSEKYVEWKRGSVTGTRSVRNGGRGFMEADASEQPENRVSPKVPDSGKSTRSERCEWQDEKRRVPVEAADRREETEDEGWATEVVMEREEGWATEVFVRRPRTRTTRKKSTPQPPEPQAVIVPLARRRRRGKPTSGLAKLAEEGLKRSRRTVEKGEIEERPEPVTIPKLQIMLSRKEINEDFLKIAGRKAPVKQPRRNTLQLLGLALCANLEHSTQRIY